MGILDRFRKKKEENDGGGKPSYILKRRLANGGMQKVVELAESTTIDQLYPNLEPGVYALHEYRTGKSGFKELWIAEVQGEPKAKAETSTEKKSPFAGLREFASEMKTMRDDLNTAFEVLGLMIGFQKVGANSPQSQPKSLIEQIREAKAEQKDYNEIFPLAATTGEGGIQKIPISGSIPAVVAYMPQVVDQAMDMIEKRLTRMGMVEPAGAQVSHEQIIKLPEKPKPVEEKKEEKRQDEMKVASGAIRLPEKPVKGEKIKKVELGEEKNDREDGEEPDDSKATE